MMTPKERAAKAIEETMFGPHEFPLPAWLHAKYGISAEAALASISEPSEAMCAAAMRELQWMPNASRQIWSVMHAAMMAEKETEE